MLERPYASRLGRGFRIDLPPDNRLSHFEYLAELLLHARCNVGNYLVDRPSQVFLHRNPIDRGQVVVDEYEPQSPVEAAETDRSLREHAN